MKTLRLLIIYGIPIIVALGVCVFFRWNTVRVGHCPDLSDYSDSEKVIYYIENFERDGEYFEVSGWFVCQDEVVLRAKMTLVLKNTETELYYKLPTELVIYNDDEVETHYEDISEYSKMGNNAYCGFNTIARIDGLDAGVYELYCLYESNDNQILHNLNREFVK